MVEVYPRGPVTPHGWFHITRGEVPLMWLDAYDDSCLFHLMGGYAIPTPEDPEAVHLTGLKGLIPPWKHIDQKGASEDGVTQVDALYDPIEPEATFEIRGRDAIHTREVDRALLGSIDAKLQSKLHFHTPDLGHWWAPIRWFKGGSTDAVRNPHEHRIIRNLRFRADNAFWRTDDNCDSFAPDYDAFTATTFDEELTGWPQYRYEGAGAGGPVGTGDGIAWDESGTTGVSVVLGPYEDFDTDTDSQVVSVVIGSPMQFGFLDGAFIDGWCRQNRAGDGVSWGGDGIRFRVGQGRVLISGWVNYVQVWERQWLKPVPPMWGEKFTFVAGMPGAPRKYQIQRNGIPIFTITESGTQTVIGADHRGTGGGMRAGAGLLSQASPSYIRKISAGDNHTVTQSGFLVRTNPGDQPMYDDYTLFGPFEKVRIWDGPGAGPNDYVEFGPLLSGQIVLLRTDPRSQTTLVQDLTVDPLPTAEANTFADALDKFLSFAGMNGAFGDQIKGLFGIKAPQGNLYRYLTGRFSDNYAIPPKSPGNPVQPYHVKVEIEDGTAESKVIVAGTPLRRSPI